ncbi:MAG: DNA repair protein RecN [bacterium]
MLKKLYINNFATVDSLILEFGQNLNILSGETGAGKSIIIESVNFLFGKTKNVGNIIRTGEKEAFIGCVFDTGGEEKYKIINAILEECGIGTNDDEVLIKRTVNLSGKSKYFINNEPANKTVVEKLSEILVNIFGQNDKRFLISNDSQLVFLDEYAGNQTFVSDIKELYKEINGIKYQLDELYKKAEDISKIKTINSYIISDAERLEISSEEDEDNIKDELIRLENINKIKETIFTASDLIENEETGILKNFNLLISLFEKLETIDPQFKKDNNLKNAFEAKLLTEDISSSLEKRSSFDYDEERLNILRTKLDLIITVENKYGFKNIKEFLDGYQKAKNEIYDANLIDEKIAELKNKLEEKKIEYLNIDKILLKNRIEASKKLEKEIIEELYFLGMKPAFNISIEHLNFDDGYSETGLAKTVFMFSANPGEEPKPLSMIASGGELSRVSLCMLKAVNSKRNAGCLIFDEIDSGIGGEVGDFIGEALRKISENSQVICITHLAQVASCGQKHLFVYKTVKDGRTYTLLKDLNTNERIVEIARMLSGDTESEASLTHAKEILKKRGFVV